MIIKKITDDRIVSGFNISIGTGIALESLFDPTKDVYDTDREFEKVDIEKYKIHYINAATLIRNIFSAVPTISQNQLLNDLHVNDVIYRTLIEELYIISNLYKDVKTTEVILFIPDYNSLSINIAEKKHKINTSKKEQIDNISFEVLSLLRSKLKTINLPMTVITGTHLLPKTIDKVLITTHIGMDLNNITRIPKLDLLESHTGKLKTKKMFYTKYHPVGKEDMSRLPWTEDLSYIFGDGVITNPMELKIRREVLEISKENHWNPLTTASKVQGDISKLTDVTGKKIRFIHKY